MIRSLLVAFVLSLLGTGLFAQINSVQPGDWDDINTWDCGCVPDVTSFDNIIVNHNVTITNDINLNLVTITSGSTVTINAGVTVIIEEDFTNTPLTIDAGGALVNNGTLDLSSLLFFTPCNVFGTLQSSSDILVVDPSILVFHSGSLYRHNYATGGDVPVVSWDPNSTVEISGLTAASPTAPGNLNQTFGNFIWNTPAMGSTTTFSLDGQLQNVVGDLTFVSTGSPVRTLRLGRNGAGYNLVIGGDFIISGGTIFLAENLSTPSVIEVAGNFNMSGGNLSLGISNNQSLSLEIAGDFSKSAGGLTAGSGSGQRNIIFNGSGVDQNYSINALTANAVLSFTVASGAVLNLGSSPIVTSGTAGQFINNGTVEVGSLNASGALQGNVPISNRVFNSGSRIVYNGLAAQFMGTAQPSATGVITEINNAAGVTLAADATVGGNLILTAGNLSVSNRVLTLNGNFTPNTNSINVLSTSSLSIGGTGAFGTLTTTGSTTINNFTLNRQSGGTVTLGSNLTIAGTFTQTQGDIILNSRTLTISGPYARTNGSFSIDAASNVTIDGSGALPSEIAFSGSQELNTLVINRSSSTVGTSSSFTVTNLNLLSGTFNNTGTITMATNGVLTRTEGSIINNTPQAVTEYDIVYNVATNISTGSEIPSLATELRHVTKTGAATVTLTQPVTINGNLTFSNGIFDAGSNSIDLKGNLIANSTSILTASPFTFSGISSISGGSIIRFGDVTVTGSVTPTVNVRIDGNLVNNGILNAGTGAQTTTFGGSTTISGASAHSFNNVTITGSLTAPASMNVAGNFALSGGTFTHSSGTVVFNGNSTITGTPQFNTISISSGATLTGPGNLTLAGNFIVNGTFTHNSGRITFNGTANQEINRTAGSAGTISLFDITVNKTSGTFLVRSTIASTIFRLENEFTLAQAGSSSPDVDFDGLTNAGTFVLASTSNRTAKITSVPAGAQIIGNLTVERFIQNEDAVRAYRYFAPAVVGATVADWLGEIQITGQFSNPSSGAGITNPNTPSLYRWTETNGGAASNRYEVWPNNISLPAASFDLTNGRGYSVFVRDTGTPTVTARGTLRFGDVGISLTSTGSEPDAAGFNLIGNPYPAPIDWDLVSLPGGVSPTISLIDNVSNGGLGAGQFIYYIQGGPTVGTFDGVIGSGQAFWVQTSSNTTLTFSESHKASAINPVILREQAIPDLLRISVTGNGRKDEAVVYFRDEATDQFDIMYDARKRENAFLNLYTYSETGELSDRYAINALKDIGCSREVLIGMDKFTEGVYSLDFTGLNSFEKPYQVTLIDDFLNQSINLNNEPFYQFEVTAEAESNGQRFRLIIAQEAIDLSILPQSEPSICIDNTFTINLPVSELGVTYYASLEGVAVSPLTNGTGGSLSLDVDKSNMVIGENEILIYAQRAGCASLPLAQAVRVSMEGIYQISSTTNGVACNSGAVTLMASGAPASGYYHWYESAEATEAIPGALASNYITTVLDKSKTYYVAAVNSLGCEGAKVEVLAVVENFDNAEISETSYGVLTSNYTSGNRWYFNDELIPDATGQNLSVTESGLYRVEVSVGSCTTMDEFEFVVTGVEDRLQNISFYPNPVVDKLVIDVADKDVGLINVISNTGQLVAQVNVNKNDKEAEVDFANMPTGLYLIRLSNKLNVVSTFKIIKK